MSDTQRTRAALLALLADNVTGQISAQDLRDFAVTVMEAELANPGDFWKQPEQRQMSDRTVRGWKDYSQVVGSDLSFGNLVMQNASGAWIRADITGSTAQLLRPARGVAAESYLSGVSTAIILRNGLVKHSNFSVTFTGSIGGRIYLASGAVGSITLVIPTSNIQVVGYVENQSDTAASTSSDTWRFDPSWAITVG